MKYNKFIIVLIFCISLPSFMLVSMEQHSNDLSLLLSKAKDNNWNYVEQHLPEYHGDINAINQDGHTLLHLAVLAEQIPCVELLIKKNANVNIESTSGPVSYNNLGKMWDNRTETPLHYAAKKGNTQIITLLLNAGAQVNSTYNKFGSTPLHIAAWFGHPDSVKLLIARGAIIDSTNDHGSTPLHVAAWRNEPSCLEILLNDGANFLKKSTTGEGNTPLYLSAKAGSLECLRILIKKYQTSENNQALDEECSGNSSTAVQAAGIGQHAQCYWDLVLAGAHYKKTLKSYQNKAISELIPNNPPLKKFIKTIELSGPNNRLLRYQGNITSCYLCKSTYKSNDVIINLNCNDAFHAHCFKEHALECFISKYKDIPSIKAIIKENPIPHQVIKNLRTHPHGNINWSEIDICPKCNKTIKINESALSIYF